MISIRTAIRRRTRATGDEADGGFLLVYVLMVITVITVVVTSTLVVATSNVVPSLRSAFSQAAEAAAQGGINAFVSYADAHCSGADSSVATCVLPTNYSGVIPIYSASGYTASYAWKADKDPSGGRYFRVTAIGTTSRGGVSVSRTLKADIAGGASMNLLDYGVVTAFETQSSASVLANYPSRTIAFDATGIANAGVPIKGSSVRWSGSSPGAAAGKVAVCNATFVGSHGRASLPPPKAPDPYVNWSESALAGNQQTHFAPCQTSFGHLTKLLAPTNPADGAGGYYSGDALMISNSFPGGTGPLVNQPVSTGYRYQQLSSPVCGAASGQNYRAFDLGCAGFPVDVGGTIDPASTYGPPQYVSVGPDVPTGSPTVPTGTSACVYNGPTRVKLNADGTATVTSPQTTTSWVAANAASRSGQCYSGATATGMGVATVNLSSPYTIRVLSVRNDGDAPPSTPAIAHGSSGWNTTGQKLGDAASSANSVFYLKAGTAGTTTTNTTVVTAADKPYTPATGDNPSTKPDGAWTPQWTSYSSGTSCTTSTATTDLKFLNCSAAGGFSATAYPTLKSTVKAALAAAPTSYTSASALNTYLTGVLAPFNSTDAAGSAPSYADNRSHRLKVTTVSDSSATDGCTPASGVSGGTTNTSIPAPSTDSFFANTAGNSAVTPSTTTTCFTSTITLQVGTCNVALVGGLCLNVGNYVWGNGTALLGGGQSVPQFKVTFTVAATATATTVTPATSTFPSMDDVTQYAMGTAGTFGTNGPGDLYLEGTATKTMAIVAQNDLIVSGTTTAADRSTQALMMIGQNNVRIYHPVKCRYTTASLISATTQGFCPNDTTALYTSVPVDGARPDQQYTNLRTDLANLNIYGALLALGNAPIKFTCPAQPGTTGICGGEFTVDNFDRGDSPGIGPLGWLTVTGTVAMAHHSPLGAEWEIADTPGQTGRPYSGYQFAERYQNLKQAFAAVDDVNGVLHTVTTTSSLWHVISTSTGTP